MWFGHNTGCQAHLCFIRFWCGFDCKGLFFLTSAGILCMLIFSATEICAELCCQSSWGHLPQLSAKFDLLRKELSVFDMKQQYILKLILLRVSLCSVQVSFHEYPVSLLICCYVYVAYLPSCFGNSKMVTECKPKPISTNFGPSRREKGIHVWKAWCRI